MALEMPLTTYRRNVNDAARKWRNIIDRIITYIGWKVEGERNAAAEYQRIQLNPPGRFRRWAQGFSAAGRSITESRQGKRRIVQGNGEKRLHRRQEDGRRLPSRSSPTLKQKLLDISRKEVPLDRVEIAAVAEAAGQLGIETENIAEFTRVMAMMGMSTNMVADEAATNLARFVNVMSGGEGVDPASYKQLGSAIVDLGNNMATTEQEIVMMGMRLVGAGKNLGLTQASIMGIAAALTSVGIRAEMGGSAMTRIMNQMNVSVQEGGEKLDTFAHVVGMTADEFVNFYKSDTEGAIIKFVTDLGTLMDTTDDTHTIFETLGFDSIRVGDTLRRSAQAGPLFAEAIDLANNAFEENTALSKEAGERVKTFDSQLIFLQNDFEA